MATSATTTDTAPITIVPQQPAGAVVVRDARYGDLPAIAAMLSRAFWDDCLLGDLIHPRRYQFPRDSDLWYLRRMRVLFWDYRRRWRIATVRQPDGAEAVIGLAHWERQGPGARKLDLWWFDPRTFVSILVLVFSGADFFAFVAAAPGGKRRHGRAGPRGANDW